MATIKKRRYPLSSLLRDVIALLGLLLGYVALPNSAANFQAFRIDYPPILYEFEDWNLPLHIVWDPSIGAEARGDVRLNNLRYTDIVFQNTGGSDLDWEREFKTPPAIVAVDSQRFLSGNAIGAGANHAIGLTATVTEKRIDISTSVLKAGGRVAVRILHTQSPEKIDLVASSRSLGKIALHLGVIKPTFRNYQSTSDTLKATLFSMIALHVPWPVLTLITRRERSLRYFAYLFGCNVAAAIACASIIWATIWFFEIGATCTPWWLPITHITSTVLLYSGLRFYTDKRFRLDKERSVVTSTRKPRSKKKPGATG